MYEIIADNFVYARYLERLAKNFKFASYCYTA